MFSLAPTLQYLDSSRYMRGHAHGVSIPKTGIVLHETVSSDVVGWSDITNVERYLANKGYGIHGMTDLEAHVAWALGMGSAIFYHAGGVNTDTIGIENVSRIPISAPTNALRRKLWFVRQKQLHKIARLCAAIHNTKPHKVPLQFWDGRSGGAGITTHWNVSRHHPESEGHTCCWPIHMGGYFPLLEVIAWARLYAKSGLHI